IMGIFAIVFYVLCYVLSTERVQEAPKKEEASFGQMLASLGRNKPLGGILVAALLLLIGSLLPGTLVTFLWLDYFNRGELQAVASLVGFAPAILLIFVAPWLARRFGKRETAFGALLLGGALMILAYVLNLQGSPFTYIVLFALSQLMVSLFNFLIWAFITDVIDFQEVNTGERDDGTIYGIYSWARKLGQAIAQGLGGFALGWVGYQATSGGEQIVQSQETLNGIYMFSTLVPGITYMLVALALRFLYPLNKSRVEENAKILAERRAAKAAEQG
ncbi:MAG: MFS transporter, partial [Propioniciclava sp.]